MEFELDAGSKFAHSNPSKCTSNIQLAAFPSFRARHFFVSTLGTPNLIGTRQRQTSQQIGFTDSLL